MIRPDWVISVREDGEMHLVYLQSTSTLIDHLRFALVNQENTQNMDEARKN